MKRFLHFLLAAISAIILLNCSGKQDSDINSDSSIEKDTLSAAQKDSLARLDSIKKYDIFPLIKYDTIKLGGYSELKKIRTKYKRSKDNFAAYKAFVTMNRQELGHVHRKERIIVPDTIIDDTRAYSVFPQYWWGAKDIPKIIVVSNALQAYACYENGRQVRFAACNTGKERTPTYPGRYSLYWREREHRSSLDSNWKMPFTINFHHLAGNAFHQFDMPGRPVSHSCVRQFIDDSEWLYYWGVLAKRENGQFIVHSGTPVIIIDYFDFNRKVAGPWMDLKSNKDLVLELPEKPMEVEDALIPISQIPVSSRWGLKNKQRFVTAEDTLKARGVIRKHVRLIETRNFNKERREKELAEKKKKEKEEEEKRLREEKLKKYITNPDSAKILEETFQPEVLEENETKKKDDDDKKKIR